MRRLAIMMGVLGTVLAQSAQGQEPLLLDAGAFDVARMSALPQTVIRSRTVLLDRGVLPKPNARLGERVRLNLFDGVVFDTDLEVVSQRTPTRYVWSGRITNEPDSSVTIAVNGEVANINVHSPARGEYQVRYVAGDVHQVHEINPAAFPPCETGPEQALPTSGEVRQPPLVLRGVSMADILVVYTESARQAVGGTTAIESLIDLAVEEANDA